MNVVSLLQREQEKPGTPQLRSGDTVRVHVKVVEGTRERIQVFEGVVITLGGKTGLATSFTVRRMAHGVGVERTFLLHSPRLDKIEVLRHGHVRRAKLYYLRDKVGKAARIRERRAVTVEEVPEENVTEAEAEAPPATRKARATKSKKAGEPGTDEMAPTPATGAETNANTDAVPIGASDE